MPDREPASQIEDAATTWAAKAERGLTAEDRADLDEWLEGDSRRLGAFVRAQAAWIHAERAAALGKLPRLEEASADEPSIDDEPQPRTLSRRLVLGSGGALAASLAAAYMLGSDRDRTLESGVGEIRRVPLAGGTILTLDTDSRVDVVLSSDDRKLELVRGKLFLEVARWPGNPLLVRAGNLILEAAAGAFSLQHLTDAPMVALVTRGTVFALHAQGMFGRTRRVAIEQNHSLRLPPDAPLRASDVRPIGAAEREQLLAWRDGMLSFGGEPLAEAVRAFDRYSLMRIVVVDPDLARQKVTGLFKADDPRGFATAVAASFGGVVTSEGRVIRIS